MNKTAKKHLAAIESGQVDRSNIVGLRKAFNAHTRAASGWGNSATAPRVTSREASAMYAAIEREAPRVVGALHDGGLAVLRNPRYAKRWTPEQARAIDHIECFRLVEFAANPANRYQFVPVYAVWAWDEAGTLRHAFNFWNIPWQSGGDGPCIFER